MFHRFIFTCKNLIYGHMKVTIIYDIKTSARPLWFGSKFVIVATDLGKDIYHLLGDECGICPVMDPSTVNGVSIHESYLQCPLMMRLLCSATWPPWSGVTITIFQQNKMRQEWQVKAPITRGGRCRETLAMTRRVIPDHFLMQCSHDYPPSGTQSFFHRLPVRRTLWVFVSASKVEQLMKQPLFVAVSRRLTCHIYRTSANMQ